MNVQQLDSHVSSLDAHLVLNDTVQVGCQPLLGVFRAAEAGGGGRRVSGHTVTGSKPGLLILLTTGPQLSPFTYHSAFGSANEQAVVVLRLQHRL